MGFRKLEGINILEFKAKYDMNVLDIGIVKKLLKEGKLSVDNGYLKINPKYIYISNTILVNFIDLDF